MFTKATKIDGKETLPTIYHTFLIKKDGHVFGELKYDRGRWKSAGGPAWQGTVFASLCNVSFHSKDQKKVLEWLKTDGYARYCDQT